MNEVVSIQNVLQANSGGVAAAILDVIANATSGSNVTKEETVKDTDEALKAAEDEAAAAADASGEGEAAGAVDGNATANATATATANATASAEVSPVAGLATCYYLTSGITSASSTSIIGCPKVGILLVKDTEALQLLRCGSCLLVPGPLLFTQVKPQDDEGTAAFAAAPACDFAPTANNSNADVSGRLWYVRVPKPYNVPV